MATDSASLEIHVLNVGQGDSVLVINRDLDKAKAAITAAKGAGGVPAQPADYVPYAVANDVPLAGTVKKALLMDGGDDEYGGDVLNYMAAHGVVQGTSGYCPNLLLAVSHYHDDHMAGLRSVFKKQVTITTKVDGKDVTSVTLEDRFRPAVFYGSVTNKATNPTSQRFAAFMEDVLGASMATADPTKVVYVFPGGLDGPGGKTVTISLGTGVDNIPITGYFLASAQGVWDAGKGAVVTIPAKGSVTDQNDRSLVLMLEYGSFRCLLGGDIAGDGGTAGGNFGVNQAPGGKAFFSQHADVESTLGPALEAFFPETTTWTAGQPKYLVPGYATVLKANHHASSSSVDVHLLATVQPVIFACSSGVKARFHSHPTQAVMNRVDVAETPRWGRRARYSYPADFLEVPNSIGGTYITEVAAKYNNKAFDVDIHEAQIIGDVVIRPFDETVSAVQNATAPGEELTIQVYGIGVLTGLSDPGNVLRDVTLGYTPGSVYPLGPVLHNDKH
ncbi:MAG: hypothetical protein ABSA53_25290 [Streptosporangiaceae bacterium]|jgi:beta-lactamase superfamily II metal-dependent hydrolase